MKKIYNLCIDAEMDKDIHREGCVAFEHYADAISEFERWKDMFVKDWNLKTEGPEEADIWIENSRASYEKYFRYSQFPIEGRKRRIYVCISLRQQTLLEIGEKIFILGDSIIKDNTGRCLAQIYEPVIALPESEKLAVSVVYPINIDTKEFVSEIDITNYIPVTEDEEHLYWDICKEINKK